MAGSMEKIAFIAGSLDVGIGSGEEVIRKTECNYGTATLIENDNFFLLPRHGIHKDIPPHRIEHRANIEALATLGVTKIVGFYSVGSLKRDILPGDIVIPFDYINLGRKLTFFDHDIHHIVPCLDIPFRDRIITVLTQRSIGHRVEGIYIQTDGPRLETRAEISMYSGFGDIIGMTMANEATLVMEKGMEYCPVCFVVNHCNGIVEEPLNVDRMRWQTGKCQDTATMIMKEIIDHDPTSMGISTSNENCSNQR